MANPVRSLASRARRSPDIGLARHRGQPGEVDPVVAGDEADERLQPASPGTTKTSDLTICPSSAPRARRGLDRGVGRLVEGHDLERHALAGGGVQDALDRGVDGGVGHGRSLASDPRPPTARACRVAPRSMAPMVGLILADGDAPRARLDAAWPDWADGSTWSSPPTAARGTRPELGVVIDLWVGDGDSLGEAGLDALAATGVPIERSRPDKDETDTELAVRAALGRAPTARHRRRPRWRRGSITRWPTSGCWPCRARRPAGGILDATVADLARSRHRRGAAAVPRRARRGAPATPCRCCRSGGDVEGVTTDGLAYPLADEPLALGPHGACRTSDRPPRRDRRRAARPSARRRIACYALAMSMPAVGDLAPEVALPDETGRSTGWPTSAAAGRSSTSTRRTTRPAAPSRRASSATATRRSTSAARTSGGSARRAHKQAPLPREVRAAVHPARRRRTTRSPRRTARGSRSRTTARRTWARRGGRSWSIRRVASRRSGRR